MSDFEAVETLQTGETGARAEKSFRTSGVVVGSPEIALS